MEDGRIDFESGVWFCMLKVFGEKKCQEKAKGK